MGFEVAWDDDPFNIHDVFEQGAKDMEKFSFCFSIKMPLVSLLKLLRLQVDFDFGFDISIYLNNNEVMEGLPLL